MIDSSSAAAAAAAADLRPAAACSAAAAARPSRSAGVTPAKEARDTPLGRLVYLRDLLRELVARDIKLRYKRTVLGVLWSLANPLAQVAVFAFVFRRVLPVHVPNYVAFVLTGILAWTWFQTALTAAAEAVTDGADLIRRPRFPTAVLPAVPIASQALHFLIALAAFVPYLALSGSGRPFTASLAALPVLVALQFGVTLALAYAAAALHVPFRDTKYILGVGLMLLFYLTPVLYSVANVPAAYRPAYGLDPLVGLIEGYRAVLLDGRPPDWPSLLPAVAATVVVLPLTLAGFLRASRRFVEEL